MTILSSDHLFQQADKLIEAPLSGAPRQVDLRRAISAAYYGIFHHALTALADEIVGKAFRATPRYALVYRSPDHASLKRLCEEVNKSAPSTKYAPYFPTSGFCREIVTFSISAADLQQKRHSADYDPRVRFVTSDAKLAIAAARSGVRRFDSAPIEQRKSFLTLLLCLPR